MSFSKYYTPTVEVRDVLIDDKRFFDTPIKNKDEAYKLDYEYFSKHYKLTAIGWSKQVELEKFNFIGKLEEDEATMFFII